MTWNEDLLDPDVDRQLLVERIVDQFAGFDDGMRTERYHLYRVLRAIDLAAILSAAIARSRRDGEPVDRAELDARVESLRTMIADEIRARLDDAAADSAHRSIEPGRTSSAGSGAGDPFDVELARAVGRASSTTSAPRSARSPAGSPRSCATAGVRGHRTGRHPPHDPPLARHRRRTARRRSIVVRGPIAPNCSCSATCPGRSQTSPDSR